jgi:PKD repeat protein
MTNYIRYVLVLMTAAFAAACTVSHTSPPPFAGPSEMSLSLAITANPDVLSLDGASQTLITVEARDSNGQLSANVPLRVQILVNGQALDFGSISARTLVTGSNGRATFTYTAPPFTGGDGTIPRLQLSVTPTGTDASAHLDRSVTVRLVQPGMIAGAPFADFTFTQPSSAAFTDVRFDGSKSTPGTGAVITSYVWDFGDGTSGTGRTATHQYEVAGGYEATLSVTDSNGLSHRSAPQTISVADGAGPTAAFVFSPTAPLSRVPIFFNGTLSTAGAGHRIVSYRWSWGDRGTSSGSTASHTYTTDGTYEVVLTVTDEAGQSDIENKQVTVGVVTPPAAVQ